MESATGNSPPVTSGAGIRYLGYALLILRLSVWGEASHPEKPVPWQIGPESAVVLEGDSTVKAWECRATEMQGELLISFTPDEVEQALRVWRASPPEALNSFTNRVELTGLQVKVNLSIQVADLKSGNRKMEHDLREALDAAHHPQVLFELTALERISSLEKDPVFHTRGKLTMAGVTQELALDFRLREQGENAYLLDSQCLVSMKSFGIDPPSGLFGLIKAHDEVTVIYRLHIVYETSPAKNLN